MAAEFALETDILVSTNVQSCRKLDVSLVFRPLDRDPSPSAHI